MRSRLSRRDVEAFAAAVDGIAPSGRDADASERVRELVDIAVRIRETPVQTARPEFVADLRTQLMVAAADELPSPDESAAPEPVAPRHRAPAQQQVRRRLTAAATAFVVAGGSFGLVAASAQSMPGDMLYPVKRGTERVELMLHEGAGEGRALLDHAATRLAEVEALANGSNPDADDLIANTLDDFTNEANAGGDLLLDAYGDSGSQDDIEDVRRFTADSAQRLQNLADAMPRAAATEYADAARAVSGLDTSAVGVCPTCGDGAPPVNVDGKLLDAVAYVLDKSDPASPTAQAAGSKHRSIDGNSLETSRQDVPRDADLPLLPDDPLSGPSSGATSPPNGDDSPTDSGPSSDGGLVGDLKDTTEDLTGGDSKPNDSKPNNDKRAVGGLLAPITDPVNDLLKSLNGL
jgi:uncharacterized protein DUF5667